MMHMLGKIGYRNVYIRSNVHENEYEFPCRLYLMLSYAIILQSQEAVFIAPIGGIPMPGFAAYGASKAALSMFSGVMRQELSKWGIKVSVLHPSGFKTCKLLVLHLVI